MARTATKKTVTKKRRAPAAAKRRSSSVPVIDIHTHIRIPRLVPFMREHKPAPQPGMPKPWVPPASASAAMQKRQEEAIAAKHLDPKARFPDLDRMGIDIQMISYNFPTDCYWMDGETGLQAARILNDTVAEFCAGAPDRYYPIGAVPMQDPPRAIAEMERIKGDGFRAVLISSMVRDKDLGDPSLKPFWAAAERLGMPIFVHPQGFSHPDRLVKFFEWNSVAQPLEEALAMQSLIYEGVMDEFPRLKLCIHHGGGYLVFYAGRADRAYETRPEVSHLKAKPSVYMRKFWYDTVVFNRDMLEFLAQKVGVDKVMMGTDYPVFMGEEDPVGFVNGAKLTKADKVKILSTNAAKLLNIPA
jgi:aminocarboxymuconate-semialdehyde decarboxylase